MTTRAHLRYVRTFNDAQLDKLDQMLRAAHAESLIASVSSVSCTTGWRGNNGNTAMKVIQLDHTNVEQSIRCEALLEQVHEAFEAWRTLVRLGEHT